MQTRRPRSAIKLLLSGVCLAVFGWHLGAANAQSGKAPPLAVALREARQVTAKLSGTLQQLLLKHVRQDNFEEAVQVCATIAQDTTHRFNQRAGHTVRRVSLKFRNPANVPDEYEQRKLESFDQLNREHKLRPEYYEVVEEDGRAYLRYLKPILTGPLCTNCHGQLDELPPRVRQFLQTRYPYDQATGYRLGEVRGAVSVKIPVRAKAEKAR